MEAYEAYKSTDQEDHGSKRYAWENDRSSNKIHEEVIAIKILQIIL